MATLSTREQRGIIIAALCKLTPENGRWSVPSQSAADKRYVVDLGHATCTCPDHQETGFKCKHLFAVEYTVKRETAADGTVTETKEITFREKKVYRQDWHAYNKAQSVEKHRLQVLLRDLCQGIEEPKIEGRGRRPHLIRDSIFAMTMKVYTTFSSRRLSCDLADAHERGHLTNLVPGMKVATFMENSAFTPILKQLISKSALPLRAVERDFAIDSSGFSSSKFIRWFDEKYGKERTKATWVKAHIACGVRTNVVTAVRILDKDAADSPQFCPWVKETRKGFEINEVSADKAYASVANFEEVAACGGTGFIAFKSNHTGAAGGLFEKMFHYFLFRQAEFLDHYHKRSNVESVFSAVKRKFGDAVRSRTDTAMKNEVLCKFLCHNLCCLIQEQHELGIEPIFWTDSPSGEMSPAVLPMVRV